MNSGQLVWAFLFGLWAGATVATLYFLARDYLDEIDKEGIR